LKTWCGELSHRRTSSEALPALRGETVHVAIHNLHSCAAYMLRVSIHKLRGAGREKLELRSTLPVAEVAEHSRTGRAEDTLLWRYRQIPLQVLGANTDAITKEIDIYMSHAKILDLLMSLNMHICTGWFCFHPLTEAPPQAAKTWHSAPTPAGKFACMRSEAPTLYDKPR